MPKRILTLTLLFCLLTASVAAPAGVASSPADSPSARQQATAKVERNTGEAGMNATLDQAGRVTRATLPVADGKKVSFDFEYDRQNRLQYITPEGSARMRLDYDGAGQWQGFSFPDGARLVFTKDSSGNINGFKQVSKPTGRQTSRLKGTAGRGAYILNAAFADDCSDAVKRATDAAVAGALVCGTSGPVACALAVAFAAYLANEARKACGYALDPDGGGVTE